MSSRTASGLVTAAAGWLRRSFGAAPRRYHGQFDPPLDRVLHERYFHHDPRDGLFVECGAFDGVTDSTCRFFEDTLGWRGVNVEPLPAAFDQLVHNRPRCTNLQLALADEVAEARFTAIVHTRFGPLCTHGSLRHHPHHRAAIRAKGWGERDTTVRVVTWRRLVADLALERVDLLVLDVEGGELAVIAGMAGCPVLPRVLCVEHGHLGVAPIAAALEPLGYRHDGGHEVNSFFLHASR